MEYINFTKELLEHFPVFREFYLEVRRASEINLLPSNLSFDFIHYLDEGNFDDDIINEFCSFLSKMKDSEDKELIMLYNEVLDDIENTSQLKNELKLRNIIFTIVDPYSLFTQDEVKAKSLKKRVEADYTGNKYIEENKKLLEEYKH